MMTSKANKKKSPLAQHLILYIILFSSIVTLLTTAAQLFIDYRKDISLIDKELSQIKEVHLPSISEALWVSNERLLQTTAEGLINLRDIEYIEIIGDGQPLIAVGSKPNAANIQVSYPVSYTNNGENFVIGELIVNAGLAGVYSRLFQRAWTILLSNALKTALVAFFMYYLFYNSMTKHIFKAVEFAKSMPLDGSGDEFDYDRSTNRKGYFDELDELRNSLLAMKEGLAESSRLAKEQQKKLELDAERFSYWKQSTLVGVLHVTADGSILDANETVRRLLGFTLSEIKAMDWRDLLPTASNRLKQVQMQKLFDTGYWNPHETEFLTKSRQTIPVLIGGTTNKADASDLTIFLVDLTKQQLMQIKLQENQKILSLALDTSSDGIWDWNIETDRVVYSAEWMERLGYEEHEVVPTIDFLHGLIHPECVNQFIESIGEYVQGPAGIFEIELRLRCKSGHYRWDLMRGKVIERSEEKGAIRFVGIDSDITERKRSEEERLSFEKNLLHSQKLESLGILAGGIAHDFNNILMGILGYSDIALTELEGESSVKGYVEGIRNSSIQAADLVKQMLAYSGKGKFLTEKMDLNKLIEDAVPMLKISMSKNAILQLRLSGDPCMIQGDPGQIQQIIMNLVINGSEAIEKGNGVVAITTGIMQCDEDYIADTVSDITVVRAEQAVPGYYSFIEVSDNGVGIHPIALKKVFEPFYTTKFTGRGLGLSAVLGIVRGHNGLLKVYSENSRGTTFKALFPVVLQEGRRVVEQEDEEPNYKGIGKFLVIDDEEAIRTVADLMLSRLGFEVITANDGQHGVEVFIANKDSISGVLLDLTMPHKDGTDTFREIKKISPGVKVILTSGYNEQEATQEFVGKGLAGFIQKPFRFNDLSKVVEKAFSVTLKA